MHKNIDRKTVRDEDVTMPSWHEVFLYFLFLGFVNVGGPVAQITMMKWITREQIRVNRTATCWLIRRFLDSEAEFIFVPADQVASIQTETGATGFDALGATYSHKDARGLCWFAALVRERLAPDPVLLEMARIVQGGGHQRPVRRSSGVSWIAVDQPRIPAGNKR